MKDAYKELNEFWKYNFNEELNLDDDDDKDKLYKLVNDLFKYELLNDNLETTFEDFVKSEKDNYIVKNIDKIIEIIENQFDDVKELDTYEKREMPYLSKENLNKYFIDFLNFVDDSGEYAQIYEELKNSGRLFFLDEDERKEKLLKALGTYDKNYENFFWKGEHNGGFVFITRHDNIDDFKALAHEFIHYVTYFKNNDDRCSNLLLEFPPMFYEMLATNYLLNKGYKQEDVISTTMNRFKYIYDESSYMANINSYLKLFLNKNDRITEKDDINMRKVQLDNYKNKIGEDKYKRFIDNSEDEITPEALASSFCDYANFYISINPCILSNTYPYIIGNYLACKYIRKAYRDREVLKEMKDITVNLPNISAEDIFNDIDKEIRKNKIKKIS